ncbi:MAG: hypothetical protein KatS3mg042_0663 [Rhodothermaceae bacterium]|nr:MAG: hypothetical protein KatS3mg042_0663 [Rhodothermaceae bacterium]
MPSIDIPTPDELADAVAERLARKLREEQQAGTALLGDLRPARLYSRREAAEYLGLHPDSVSRIPATELPRTRGRYLGLHIMQYQAGLDPTDYEAYVKDLTRRLTDAAPPVRPLSPTRKTRVL